MEGPEPSTAIAFRPCGRADPSYGRTETWRRRTLRFLAGGPRCHRWSNRATARSGASPSPRRAGPGVAADIAHVQAEFYRLGRWVDLGGDRRRARTSRRRVRSARDRAHGGGHGTLMRAPDSVRAASMCSSPCPRHSPPCRRGSRRDSIRAGCSIQAGCTLVYRGRASGASAVSKGDRLHVATFPAPDDAQV